MPRRPALAGRTAPSTPPQCATRNDSSAFDAEAEPALGERRAPRKGGGRGGRTRVDSRQRRTLPREQRPRRIFVPLPELGLPETMKRAAAQGRAAAPRRRMRSRRTAAPTRAPRGTPASSVRLRQRGIGGRARGGLREGLAHTARFGPGARAPLPAARPTPPPGRSIPRAARQTSRRRRPTSSVCDHPSEPPGARRAAASPPHRQRPPLHLQGRAPPPRRARQLPTAE